MEKSPALTDIFGERRRQQAPEQNVSVRAAQNLSMAIAEFMLWITIATDKRSARRAARKAVLMNRWMQLSGDLKLPMPGVVLL